MGIGVGITLLALGAVLTFAVKITASGINLQTVGIILMAAGALGLALDLAVFAPRRRRRVVTTDETSVGGPAAPGVRRTTVDERV